MTTLTLVPREPEPEYPTFRIPAAYLDWLLVWLKTDEPLPVLRLGPGVGQKDEKVA